MSGPRPAGNSKNGMTHHPVWPTELSELPLVVTARLHVTSTVGVTKVCPGTRQAGCHHLDRNEDRSQVHRDPSRHPHQDCVDAKGK